MICIGLDVALGNNQLYAKERKEGRSAGVSRFIIAILAFHLTEQCFRILRVVRVEEGSEERRATLGAAGRSGS